MHLRQRSDISIREVDGETIILDQQAGQVHTLNQTAAFIWSRCDGTRSETDIAALLSETFEVDKEVAERDTSQVLMELRDLGLLVADPL